MYLALLITRHIEIGMLMLTDIFFGRIRTPRSCIEGWNGSWCLPEHHRPYSVSFLGRACGSSVEKTVYSSNCSYIGPANVTDAYVFRLANDTSTHAWRSYDE